MAVDAKESRITGEVQKQSPVSCIGTCDSGPTITLLPERSRRCKFDHACDLIQSLRT